jgi:hypothetical protein
MNKTKFLMTAGVALMCVAACNRSSDELPAPTTGTTVEINASAWGKWVYFSFATGDTVGTDNTSLNADATWKERLDWDIAFHRNDIRTNGGVSGNGAAGVFDANTADFNAVTTAPAGGYTTDTDVPIMIAMGSPQGPTYLTCGGNTTFNSWAQMDAASMTITVIPKIFVVRTADGKYAKVYMRAYKNAEGASARLTMDYFYQPDGSSNLLTQ